MTLSRDSRKTNVDAAAEASDTDRCAPDRSADPDAGLAPGMSGLLELMDRLLAPDGCPWDREQTLTTLRPYLLEETYEVLEAMDDPIEHQRELGDLLFQIVFQSALREREGAFGFEDVVTAIRDKMVRRHPHVFARSSDDRPLDPDEVAKNWSKIKAAEKRAQGQSDSSPIAGVPKGLPALQRAWRLQEKAAAVGFDWPDVEGVAAKIDEEWSELREAVDHGDRRHMHEELGDLLFVVVRLAQKLGLEPEDALRDANTKFERRFGHVVAGCEREGIDIRASDLATLERFWTDAKQHERAQDPEPQ